MLTQNMRSYGLFEGAVGAEEDFEDTESEPAPNADAFATAIAARLSANDPGVSRKTEEFLAEQTWLVAVQRKILEEEHALRHSKLQGQRMGIYIRLAKSCGSGRLDWGTYKVIGRRLLGPRHWRRP
jgi:hypothetical protein